MAKRPWWPKYVADYRMDTLRLSLREHGAYNLLLDDYYYRGSLPANAEQLHDICNAIASEDKAAVDAVAAKYFEVAGDRLIQKRVEVELEKFQELSQKRRQVAERRWKKGEMQKQCKSNAIGMQVNANHNHNHNHINTPPNPPKGGTAGKGDSEKKSSNTQNDEVNLNLTKEARSILEYLNRVTGRNYQPKEGTLKEIKARLKDGMKPEKAREVIFEKWRQWGEDEDKRDWVNPKTLFRESNYWRYEGEL